MDLLTFIAALAALAGVAALAAMVVALLALRRAAPGADPLQNQIPAALESLRMEVRASLAFPRNAKDPRIGFRKKL